MQFIMVSHGDLAKAMLGSAQMIVGEQEKASTFGLHPAEDVSTLRNEIKAKLKEIGSEDVIIFTDLYHGSPFNVVVSLMEEYKFHHITGMNLGLILEALMMRLQDKTVDEICEKLIKVAPTTFMDVNKQLAEIKVQGDV